MPRTLPPPKCAALASPLLVAEAAKASEAARKRPNSGGRVAGVERQRAPSNAPPVVAEAAKASEAARKRPNSGESGYPNPVFPGGAKRPGRDSVTRFQRQSGRFGKNRRDVGCLPGVRPWIPGSSGKLVGS